MTARAAQPSSRPAGAPRGTRIDLDDVAKRYRIGQVTVSALEGVNLHVDEAAFVVILRPSGSGKTTLLNLIGALDVPSEGTVRIAGIDITGAGRAARFALRRHTVSFIFPDVQPVPRSDRAGERSVRRRRCRPGRCGVGCRRLPRAGRPRRQRPPLPPSTVGR